MGKGKRSPQDCLEWSLVSGRRSIFSDRQDFVHKLEFEISKGKKKRRDLCMCGDDSAGDVPLGLLVLVLYLSFVLPHQLAWQNCGGLCRYGP